MAAEDAATEPDIDEQDDGEGERERSKIAFPYADLDNAIRLVKGVHQVGGMSSQLDQLAAQLNVAVKGGGFRQMVSSAKTFGLSTFGRGSVNLTALGQRVIDPKQEKAAKAEAFLAVPLYRAIYDMHKGGTIPPTAALESEMVNLGVAKRVTDRARQIFQRSAQQAGFFAFGQDRLIMPATGPGDSAPPPPDPRGEKAKGKTDNGGEGGEGGGRHPFIAGLLRELPSEGAEWTTDERRKWLQAAAMIFDIIYKNGGSGTMLKIEVEKTSAK